ncbi:cell envelope integrity protein CreD [Bacteroidia bacterium]|nr:cell envelope integrity protein CreD [Bacteroidia bacterium]
MEIVSDLKLKKKGNFSQSITLKAVLIAFMTLLMLGPEGMIRDLIQERQYRSLETIEKINDKWSQSQTLCGPILSIQYSEPVTDENKKVTYMQHFLHITPEDLNIETKLLPEERHYGIYKTILYNSEISITGNFLSTDFLKFDSDAIVSWDKVFMTMGFTDLRGITDNLVISFNGKPYTAEVGGVANMDNSLVVNPEIPSDIKPGEMLSFSCKLKLKGSSSIHFIPVGKTSMVHLTGDWKSPSYIGNFSPDINQAEEGIDATWGIMRFNRNIPEIWKDGAFNDYESSSFGVRLVDPVDHYQQNMRSAKYALLFIILTFVVFFFIELLTKKRIHPIQYLLVAVALLLFYTLLLSISEQVGFGWAYLTASTATIGLITFYSHSIFKDKVQTGIMAFTLLALYIFLYTVLQLEDIALLIGSIGLFTALAIVMYISRKIAWYKQEETD